MTDKVKTEVVEFPKDDEFVIYTTSAKRMNRVRDIGLIVVAGMVFMTMFFGWREAANRETVDNEIREAYKIELRKFRGQVESLHEDHKKSVLLKEDLVKEAKTTRQLMFSAYQDHKKELQRLTVAVETLEKQLKKGKVKE